MSLSYKNAFTVYSATRKIANGSGTSDIFKCHYNSLTQKKNKCKEKCHVEAKVSQDNSRDWVWQALPKNHCDHQSISFDTPFCHGQRHVY